MQAYNAGLHRRWLDEREERERQLKEQTGEAMKAAYLDAVMQPYQKRADDFSQNAVGTFNANNSIIAEALLGGTEAPEAQTAIQGIGKTVEEQRTPLVSALDAAKQRAQSAQNMSGEAFLRVYPYLAQMEQTLETRYKQDLAEKRAQAAIAEFQAATTPQQKASAALKYQWATGKSIDSHFYTPQYKEVSPGATLIDPATGRVIYAAPKERKFGSASWGTYDTSTGQPAWRKEEGPLKVPENLQSFFEEASAQSGIPVGILHGVASAESSFNPGAISPAGALGVMQLMPGTAKELGINPYDPQQNIMGGARYLRQMYDKYGDWPLAFAAYNAGPGAVDAAIKQAGSADFDAIAPYLPKETREYVPKVFSSINRPAAMGGGGMSAAEKRQYDAAVRIVAMHEKWMKDNANSVTGVMPDPKSSPYYQEAQAALGIIRKVNQRELGGGKSAGQQKTDYYEAMNKVTQLLNQGKFSREQIEAAIRADYGDMAEKIIQDIDWNAWPKYADRSQQPQNLFPYAAENNFSLPTIKRNEEFGPYLGP